MTIKEMKELNKEIERLRSRRLRLSDGAVNVSPSLSGMPGTVGASDKLGAAIATIADIDSEIKALSVEYHGHLHRLSFDKFEENCIYLYLAKRYTWRRIARSTVGRVDAAESIRKRCARYQW